MSYKLNQQDPTRRPKILARREKYRGHGTNPAQVFLHTLYVPGNGPHHKLGRSQYEVFKRRQLQQMKHNHKLRIKGLLG